MRKALQSHKLDFFSATLSICTSYIRNFHKTFYRTLNTVSAPEKVQCYRVYNYTHNSCELRIVESQYIYVIYFYLKILVRKRIQIVNRCTHGIIKAIIQGGAGAKENSARTEQRAGEITHIGIYRRKLKRSRDRPYIYVYTAAKCNCIPRRFHTDMHFPCELRTRSHPYVRHVS